MRILTSFCSLAACAALAAGCAVSVTTDPQGPQQPSQSVASGAPAGAWETDYENLKDSGTKHASMTLTQNGSAISGNYADGTLSGQLQGNKVTGTWQRAGKRGAFEFDFDSGFSKFSGWWTFETESQRHNWTGHR